jgi:hypothetical protein
LKQIFTIEQNSQAEFIPNQAVFLFNSSTLSYSPKDLIDHHLAQTKTRKIKK